MLRIDPNNVDAQKELTNIAILVRQYAQKEKKVFGNIFAKAGLYDDVKTTEMKPEVKKVESESEDDEEIKAPEEPEAMKPEEATPEAKAE